CFCIWNCVYATERLSCEKLEERVLRSNPRRITVRRQRLGSSSPCSVASPPINTTPHGRFTPLVPKVGFEPTWGYPHPLLRRARLPFRHFGSLCLLYLLYPLCLKVHGHRERLRFPAARGH